MKYEERATWNFWSQEMKYLERKTHEVGLILDNVEEKVMNLMTNYQKLSKMNHTQKEVYRKMNTASVNCGMMLPRVPTYG